MGKRGIMDFSLREFDKKEMLSVYRRFVANFFDGSDESEDFLISEAAVKWLLAKGVYRGYGLYDDKKHLLCFGMFISDRASRTLLLNYFAVLKKYRGYNYPEIFFELLKLFFTDDSIKEERKERLPFGIFLELGGAGDNKAFSECREKELNFYKKMGAYMTDIIPALSGTEYNVLFLPINEKPSMSDLLREIQDVYKEILPSFKDRKKYIKRLTEEVDGLV